MIKTKLEAVKGKLPPTPNSQLPTLTLDTPIQFLKGVGPKRFAFFKRLNLATLRDLIYHFPRRHEDRRIFLTINQLVPGQKQTARGIITGSAVFRAKTGTVILQVVVKDATGTLIALWFNQPYMRRWFPKDQEVILYGLVEPVGKRFQMMAPEFELVPPAAPGQAAPARSLHMGRVVPIYPATSGLHQRELRAAVAAALRALLLSLPDPLPEEIRERHHLPSLRQALRDVHFPPKPEAVTPAQDRLTFDELFYFQAALGLRKTLLSTRSGIAHETNGDLVNRFRASLPFQFTPGQEKAIQEIAQDMAASQPMRRLIQGEVGSGKTAVAAYAIAVAVQSGFQAAVMCPTELLARQHALTLTQLLSAIDLPVGLATSAMSEPQRRELGRQLEEGGLPLMVGTHALLEPWVRFRRLGLVVIDEQQKFGVDQRQTLLDKGEHPDFLILTATPIPRTLALTLYGEMEISTITERPAGRQPVKTLWMDSTRRDAVMAFVRKELDAGRQAYVVCPRIEKEASSVKYRVSSKTSLSALTLDALTPSPNKFSNATELFEEYQKKFADYRVGLLHGRMSSEERERVFTAFRRGEVQILVATQIIEVGVDMPNATIMIIEGADRFGLSQLHQLRGRVGRGRHEATCILMADPKSPSTLERLGKVVEAQDAFSIAEEDLRLRGPGELLGKRQAGLPDLKCLAHALQGPWMEITREEAQRTALSETLKREVRLRFPKLTEGCA